MDGEVHVQMSSRRRCARPCLEVVADLGRTHRCWRVRALGGVVKVKVADVGIRAVTCVVSPG